MNNIKRNKNKNDDTYSYGATKERNAFEKASKASTARFQIKKRKKKKFIEGKS